MLSDQLAMVLARDPGRTAAELAELVGGMSEQVVSFALLADHQRFRCERGLPRRWRVASVSSAAMSPGSTDPTPVSSVGTISTSRTMGLYPWQTAALEAWVRAGRRGVVEAVTGTGKTMVGVSATLTELDRAGQALVIVPSVELAHQWVAELAPRLPAGRRVGILGAGRRDSLATHYVVVAVVNSARAIDLRPIHQGGLLVADECHRYGSAVNHLALDGRFRHRLGLSATYARDDDGNEKWLDPYFGRTCFRLGYRRALDEGVTARFTVTLLGVRFAAPEQARYDELTESMGKWRARLVGSCGVPGEPFDAFMRVVSLLAEGDTDEAGLARAWLGAMLERRRLLADTPAKDAAVSALAASVADADRAIVFTQSIAASERACRILVNAGLRARAVHSGLKWDARREVLGRFATGDLDVLSAPRLLDEGLDVLRPTWPSSSEEAGPGGR